MGVSNSSKSETFIFWYPTLKKTPIPGPLGQNGRHSWPSMEVSRVRTWTSCSQTICQKQAIVCSRGCCAMMNSLRSKKPGTRNSHQLMKLSRLRDLLIRPPFGDWYTPRYNKLPPLPLYPPSWTLETFGTRIQNLLAHPLTCYHPWKVEQEPSHSQKIFIALDLENLLDFFDHPFKHLS